MNRFNVKGPIFYCRDYVNTDVMAPGRFDPIYEDEKLAEIALIDYDGVEPFVNPRTGRSRFAVIVAGQDFGCGSSRETAPMAIAAAGVRVIIAKSFARIFFRNCVNMGEILPLIVNHNFSEEIHGEGAEIDFGSKKLILGKQHLEIPPLGVVEKIIRGGGLSQYVKESGGLV